MQENRWKSIGAGVRLIWDMDRMLLFCSLAASVAGTAVPFIGIFLSAYVLDGLQNGTDIKKLLSAAFFSAAAVFLLTGLEAFFKRCKEVHTDQCGKRYHSRMSMKTISMDFPLLDSPAVNDIRARIMHDNDWGAGFYSLVWKLPDLLDSMISAVLAMALLLPLFVRHRMFTDITAVVLLFVCAFVIVSDIWFISVKKKEHFQLLDDPSLDKSYLGYFLWRGQDYHYGKDVRIYRAKPLIDHKLQGDVAVKDRWTYQIVRNQMQSGFYQSFSAGFLQTAAWIFVVLRAASGVLSAGAVVKYAGMIYKFAQSIADVFFAMEEYASASRRQMSTMEYLNIPDILKKGKLPVEKRAFCDDGDNEYEIEFCDVSFRYPGSDAYALRHISLKFQIGQRLAVVGMNGSGKTTFIKLLGRCLQWNI